MRFVPSAYSDAAAVTTLDARPQSVQDAQDIASGISEASQVAAQLISSGADVARAASDAKLAAWQKKAAKKAKKKKQKAATTAPMPALPATRAPAPVAAPQTDWAKWGLIGMGALVVGVLGFVLVSRLRSSGDDDSKAKKNPVARKPFIRVPPPRRRVPKVIDIEAEEVEEVEPEPVEQGDDYGDDYGDAEGEE